MQAEEILVVSILMAVVAVALVARHLVNKKLRMPDHGWKAGLIIFAVGAAGVTCYFGWPLKQGIDLKGGVILVYEIDEAKTERASGDRGPSGTGAAAHEPVDMDALVTAVTRRVNPGGVQEVVVRQVGDQQVEIIVPDVGSKDIDLIKERVRRSGYLRFLIVANQRNHGHIMSLADEPANKNKRSVRNSDGQVVAEWVPLAIKKAATEGQEPEYRVDIPEGKTRIVNNRKEVLMVVDPDNPLEGRHLYSVRVGTQDLNWAVFFDMTAQGAVYMGRITERNRPDRLTGHQSRLGIVMDDEVISAPVIRSTITNSGYIEGDFTQEEAQVLVDVLRAGRLPAVLTEEPVAENAISPLLGKDTIRQGKLAVAFSLVGVLIFTLVYYQFAGVIACLGLLANLLLILAAMLFIRAALSLPGMAGLVLTVGMSVDANVLIYERIREELRRGAGLRMAIRNGFDRATTTIVDSQLTTLLTAVVLYAIGTEMLKGFAIPLILGIVLTLFTAVFCTRVAFEILERQRWLTRLRMMQFLTQPNYNFFGVRKIAITISCLVIVVGLVATAVRGRQMLDIDFLGGSSVQMVLNKPLSTAQVRSRLSPRLTDLSVTEVHTRSFLLSVGPAAESDLAALNKKAVPNIVQTELAKRGIPLPQNASVRVITAGREWRVIGDERAYIIERDGGRLNVYDSASGTVYRIDANPRKAEVLEQIVIDQFKDQQGQSLLRHHSMDYGPPVAVASADTNQDAVRPGGEPPATPQPPQNGPATAPTSQQPAANAEVEAATFPDGNERGSEGATAEAASASRTPATTSASPGTPDNGSDGETASDPRHAVPRPPVPPGGEETTPPPNTPSNTEIESSAPDSPLPTGQPPLAAARSRSTLTFDERINVETVRDQIDAVASKLGLALSQSDIALSNPEWDGASSRGFAEWQLELPLAPEEMNRLLDAVEQQLDTKPVWLASNTIGGSVAARQARVAIGAVLVSLLGIIGYIWVRFQQVAYGLAAVVALVHDVLFGVGLLALSYWLKEPLAFLMIDEFKISTPVMAALLTLIGYSLNDTIVIFDRIREVKGKTPYLTEQMINDSVNQTLSRTILTGGTTLLSVIVLYIVGGQAIHAFAFVLLAGIIVGTYSSIYIASPFLFWMSETKEPQRARETVAV